MEVPVGYSYMRFNPENSDIVSGFSPNGGGGGVTVFVSHAFGISAEFNGYSSLTKTFTFPATANSPCPAGCTVKADGNLFTYNVGPVSQYHSEHFEPFVERLSVGVHSNTYQNLFRACQATCTTTDNPSNHAFDFVMSVGIDIPVTTPLLRASKTRAISVTKPESFCASNGIAERGAYSTIWRRPQIALRRPEQAAVHQFVFQE